jgi:hypothetical protein
MYDVNFTAELEAIDAEILRRAFDCLSTVDPEIEMLSHRLDTAMALRSQDLADRLRALMAERVALREVAQQVIANAKTLDAAPEPVADHAASNGALPDASIVATIPEPAPAEAAVPEPIEVEPVPAEPVPAEPVPVPSVPVSSAPVRSAPPKPTLTLVQFRKRCRAFFTEERALQEVRGWKTEEECRCKSLVCECRALLESARELEQDDSNLRQSLEMLSDALNAELPNKQFFGFNRQRTLRVQVWSDLAEAFGLIPAALACLEHIDEIGESNQEAHDLVVKAAAVESWIYRTIREQGIDADDSLRTLLHQQVVLRQGDTYVPWWKMEGSQLSPTPELIEEARSCASEVERIRTENEILLKKSKSLDLLLALRDAVDADGEFETTIVPAISACLAGGIQPSRKELVSVCLPYCQALKDLNCRTFAKLIEFLDKEQMRLLAKHKALPDDRIDPEEELDETFQMWLEDLRNKLQGKVVLFMGGRRQRERAEEFEKLLGLKELVWPDASNDSTPEKFRNVALRADVVCYLIRWSRHNYKQILDLAKSEGKLTVVIKAGLGKNRLIHDMYHQLNALPA